MDAVKKLEKLMEEYKNVLIRLRNEEEKSLPLCDCPYCSMTGECTIDNPIEDCDSYYYFNAEEDENE